MSWWKRIKGDKRRAASPKQLRIVRPMMPGWNEEPTDKALRVWRDPHGDVLTFSTLPGTSFRLPDLSDITALQGWCRAIAEARGGGLIEAGVVPDTPRPAVRLISKRLELPAYIFTGMLIIPCEETYEVWTLVAGERLTTGEREAIVTAELFNSGKLKTPQEYQAAWHDPYDPNYRGVDPSVLCFISDDRCYDEWFPEHPLSRVRNILAKLPHSIQVVLPS
jgi:hypothetical protein